MAFLSTVLQYNKPKKAKNHLSTFVYYLFETYTTLYYYLLQTRGALAPVPPPLSRPTPMYSHSKPSYIATFEEPCCHPGG